MNKSNSINARLSETQVNQLAEICEHYKWNNTKAIEHLIHIGHHIMKTAQKKQYGVGLLYTIDYNFDTDLCDKFIHEERE